LRSDKFWLFILAGVVMIAAITALLIGRVQAGHACIYQDGILIDTVDLAAVTEPYTITVEGDRGINVIAVERNRVRMLSADCPDGTCVRQGWISGGVMPIVCLPHRLVIGLEGGVTDVDAVVG